MNPLFLSPTFWFSTVIALVTSFAFLFFNLYQSEVKDHAQFRSDVATTQKQNEVDAALRLREAEANTESVARSYADYADGIAHNLNSRLDRLRRDASNSATMRLVAEASSDTDARPADAGPGAAVLEAEFKRLETDCAQTTGQFLYLREWVVRVCK